MFIISSCQQVAQQGRASVVKLGTCASMAHSFIYFYFIIYTANRPNLGTKQSNSLNPTRDNLLNVSLGGPFTKGGMPGLGSAARGRARRAPCIKCVLVGCVVRGPFRLGRVMLCCGPASWPPLVTVRPNARREIARPLPRPATSGRCIVLPCLTCRCPFALLSHSPAPARQTLSELGCPWKVVVAATATQADSLRDPGSKGAPQARHPHHGVGVPLPMPKQKGSTRLPP